MDSTPKRTEISAFIPPGTGAPQGKAPRRVTDKRILHPGGPGGCVKAPRQGGVQRNSQRLGKFHNLTLPYLRGLVCHGQLSSLCGCQKLLQSSWGVVHDKFLQKGFPLKKMGGQRAWATGTWAEVFTLGLQEQQVCPALRWLPVVRTALEVRPAHCRSQPAMACADSCLWPM